MKFIEWVNGKKNVLLIQPDFPRHKNSRNHSKFLPIGLLKIASYLKTNNVNVKLVQFNETIMDVDFKPDLICVTSLFTYWSEKVKDVVTHCRKQFGDVPVIIGGIYASLMPEHCKEYTQCDDVIEGIIPEVEPFFPDYSLVDVDRQIIHTTRGCVRKCGFCGTYKIEPNWICRKSIRDEIEANPDKKKIIFYDNNLLANEYIEGILLELTELKKERKINYVESQSGFDGRILRKKPHLARMLKEAGFKNPKIAWDYGIKQAPKIKEQVDLLVEGGFNKDRLSIFILYNYDLHYEEVEEKRAKCAEWGVQVIPCRYRPLNATFDNYNPYKKSQKSNEYYICEKNGWTDAKIRKFNSNVRRHNVAIRCGSDYYSSILERKILSPEDIKEIRGKSFKEIKQSYSDKLPDAWHISEPHIE